MYQCQQCGCDYITSRLDYICSTKCATCFKESKSHNAFSSGYIRNSNPFKVIAIADSTIPLAFSPSQSLDRTQTAEAIETDEAVSSSTVDVEDVQVFESKTCKSKETPTLKVSEASKYTSLTETETARDYTDIETVGDDIDIEIVGNDIDIETVGDDIDIETVGNDIDIEIDDVETKTGNCIDTETVGDIRVAETTAAVEDGQFGSVDSEEYRSFLEIFDRSDTSSPERESSSDSDYEPTKFLSFYEGDNKGKYKYCDSYLKEVPFEEIGLTTAGKKPYKCRPCRRIFFSKTQRKNHDVVHSEEGDILYSGVKVKILN